MSYEIKTIYNDPCMLAAHLRKIYVDRIGAGAVKMVRTKSLDNEREAQWYQTGISDLRAEMLRAEDDCRASQGLPKLTRRFAIGAGSLRRPQTSRSITDE